MVEDSSASWEFGYGGSSDGRAYSMIVPLTGPAGSTTISATPTATNGRSIPYPTVDGIAADDLVLAIAVQQTTDELLSGPEAYSLVANTTGDTPQRVAVHSTIAEGTSETPGNATWDGRVGGKVQLTVSFSNTASPAAEAATATGTAYNATVSFGVLDVSATPTSAFSSSGPPTVSNPDSGTSNTFLFIAVGQGPSNEGSPTITAPDAGATQVFDYGGAGFVPRVRCWTFEDDASANWTFGFGGTSDGRAFSVIVPLDGVAGTVTATATPTAGSSASRPYPTLSGIAANDLVLAIGVQQTTDQMTSGPAGYTQEHNSTASTPERVVVHSFVATGSSETPGNATWSGTVGAKVQLAIAFRSA